MLLIRSPRARALLAGVAVALGGGAVAVAAAKTLHVPLSCTKGPDGQHYDTIVLAPASAAEDATYTVRVDGVDSGEISHTGLNYIHDMSTDFGLPKGATYVDGSARVVPDTGTSNARDGARVWHEGDMIRMTLPAHVDNGSRYTAPSIEFRLHVVAPSGSDLPFTFLQYRVNANAFVIGDVATTCDPKTKPFTLVTTTVASP